MKIIQYDKKYKLDKKIKSFILNILINEFKQGEQFYRPDLDNLSIYKNTGGELFVLIDENQILGTIAIKFEANKAILKRFYLTKSIRKKGWGRKLFSIVLNFCKEKNISIISLNNDSKKMKDAYNFYIKMGFKKVHSRRDGYTKMMLKLN